MKNSAKILSKMMAYTAVVIMVTSCGANNDILATLGSATFPVLTNFSSTGANYSGGTGFSSNTPFWTFNAGVFSFYLSPAKGVVSSIGGSGLVAGTSYVTIIHSARLATVVHGLSSVNVRAGDQMYLSQMIGQVGSAGLKFQVLLDSVPVCPLSFVDSTIRATIMNNPCQ